MAVPETLRLYTTATSIRVEPVYNDGRRVSKMIEIDRETHGIKAVEAAVLSDSNVTIVYGVLGTIRLLAGPYLIVVTQRKRVGAVLGHDIWRLLAAELIPFASTPILTTEQRVDEEKYTQMLMGQLTSGFFYFSYSYDLTNTVQTAMSLPPEVSERSLWTKADKSMMWNCPLCYDLAEAGDVDEFILPMIQGYVDCVLCSVYYHKVEVTLITRRSRNRGGTRYNERGVDWEGHTANFCAVEQVVQWGGAMAAYVQTRGSIPLFWTQYVDLKYHPPVKLLAEDHFLAFAHHCQDHLQAYGPTTFVNLVGSRGKDLVLSQSFEQQVSHFASNHVRYVHFDFNKECSNNRWHCLSQLMDTLGPDLKEHGYCGRAAHGVVGRQVGVFRTNCIDCLDRTNVVQSVIARRVLQQQLHDFGILPVGESVENIPSLVGSHRRMWADNGDAISMIYAGTAALKGDFTRTGERSLVGLLQDGYHSVMRYWLNNFADGARQDAIDLLLNNYQVSPYEPSPFTVNMVQQRLRLLPLGCVVSTLMLAMGLLLPADGSWFRMYYIMSFSGMAVALWGATLYYGRLIVDTPCLVRAAHADPVKKVS